jgi:PKD repeat protein
VDNQNQADWDGDGLGDACDLNADDDGALDVFDAFPTDPGEWFDTDGDGMGDNADLDRDGDGVDDGHDNCVLEANGGQGDLDNDGIGDACDLDEDGDGILDVIDVFPRDDGDSFDADGDGLGDNADPDDDGDGVPDVDDALPFNGAESSDNDGDGVGDNADTDDDNDGQTDDDETACGSDPLDAGSLSPDNDGDNSPNCVDNCAAYNPDQTDSNNDGQGDACDPVVTAVSGPIDPVNINDQQTTLVPVSGTFTDADDGDDHTATWDWGDGSNPEDGAVDQANNSVSGSHTYAEPGVYEVTLTVEDSYPASDSYVYQFIVIYDPDGGFVTGGGWIMSPAGACPVFCGDATGKANFGFVSKYKKGASTPTGQTEFQFKAGNLNFHSDSYEWLVVTGSDYAMFKGSGTINGMGDYRFMLWAGDDEPDTFRIRIWEEDEATGVETDVYDNGFEGSGYETGQPIAGGSIVVHTGKKK